MSTLDGEQPRSEFEIETEPGQASLGDATGEYWERIKGGDLGSLPAVLGCVVLVIVFGVMEPDSFLTEQNFANLLNQGAAIMVLAMGLVFVLLLGEIDLSAGFTAGMGAAILGVTLTDHGWAWPLSVLAALATGVAIGFTIALLVARLGIPSFVVSLAFFLGLQGAMLLIIGEGGTIPIRNEAILKVMNENMPVGARLAAGRDRRRRLRGELVPGDPAAQARRAADAGAVGVGGQGRRPRGGRVDRRLPAQPGAPAPERADRHPGRPVGRPAGRRARRRARVPAHAHVVRSSRLRGRRQRRGGAARGHQRPEHQDDLLHHVLDARDRRGHPAGLA